MLPNQGVNFRRRPQDRKTKHLLSGRDGRTANETRESQPQISSFSKLTRNIQRHLPCPENKYALVQTDFPNTIESLASQNNQSSKKGHSDDEDPSTKEQTGGYEIQKAEE